MRSSRLSGRRRRTGGPPGIVLVLAILLIGLFTVMGLSMINLAGSDYTVSNNESRSIQALFNSDAGLEEAKMRLSPNAPGGVYDATTNPSGKGIKVEATEADWRAYILSGQTAAAIQAGLDGTYGLRPDGSAEDTTKYRFYDTVQTGTNKIPWGWARIQLKRDAGGLVYWDPVAGTANNTSQQSIGTPPMTVYNPPILVITAEGIQNGVRRVISAEYRPQVTPPVAPSTIITDPFANAVHAGGGPPGSTFAAVELIGNAYTDSYDSRIGNYNVGGNKGYNGDVSTDAVRNGVVSIGSNSEVGGDILCGPTCTTSGLTPVSNSGTIRGTVGEMGSAWAMPAPSVPTGLTNLGAMDLAGNTKKDGCSLTLTEGSYWYSSISITGQGKLCVTGQVTLYVSGTIAIAGEGVATAQNKPPNFLIYGTSTSSNVSITGNGNFYGAVYAPNAFVDISGNGAVYGAVAGQRVRINGNGGFHYDEALGHVGEMVKTDPGTNVVLHRYNRYIWREVPF